MKKLILFVSVLCLAGGLFLEPALAASKKVAAPYAVIYKVKGKVTYTKKGKKWKKLRRNKFLFAKYQIKTGADGVGTLTHRVTGKSFALKPNSLIQVTKNGFKLVEGTQLVALANTNPLADKLLKRFKKSHSYTTVRRGLEKSGMSIVKDIVVSDGFPYIVWENYGEKYSYTLTVGDVPYNIAPTEDKIVKVKLAPFSGKQELALTAFAGGEKKLELEKVNKRGRDIKYHARYLSAEQTQELQTAIKDIKGFFDPEDPSMEFMIGRVYVDNEMWIPAMEYYKRFLQDNPDEQTDVMPHLLSVYRKLAFRTLYKDAYNEYKAALKK